MEEEEPLKEAIELAKMNGTELERNVIYDKILTLSEVL